MGNPKTHVVEPTQLPNIAIGMNDTEPALDSITPLAIPQPELLLILGSGLGHIADTIDQATSILTNLTNALNSDKAIHANDLAVSRVALLQFSRMVKADQAENQTAYFEVNVMISSDVK